MNIDNVENKAKLQAVVSETLDHLQEQCKVDRETARRFLEFEAKLTSTRMKQIIQAGAENGPFGSLQAVLHIMQGASAAIHILQTDPDL